MSLTEQGLLAALASYVTGQDTAADSSACGFDDPLVTAEVTTADGTAVLTYAIGTAFSLSIAQLKPTMQVESVTINPLNPSFLRSKPFNSSGESVAGTNLSGKSGL